ncbi:MAG: TatD family hydrolase, partial [Patescibacteria group bacterium]
MALNLIDTHAHLDFSEFSEDQSEVIRRAAAAGVTKIVNAGCDAGHFKSSLELAAAHDGVFAAIGYHPHEAVGMMASDQHSIEQNVAIAVGAMSRFVPSKKLVAIGEIGLDYYRLAPSPSNAQLTVRDLQEKLLVAQLVLASENTLPVIIHCREAYPDLLRAIKEFQLKKKIRGVIHCFEGTYEEAVEFVSLGFKISFTGNLTYERQAGTIKAAKEIPLADIMIETDCPNLAPAPLRGQRNEPAYVEYVCRRLADIRGAAPE